jgi:hypothetical protein
VRVIFCWDAGNGKDRVCVGTLLKRAAAAIGQRDKAVGNNRGCTLANLKRVRGHRQHLM